MVPVPNTCMAWLFLIPDPFWHNILLVCQVLLVIESSWGHTVLCIADHAGKVSNIHLFFQIFPHVLSEGFLPAHLSPHPTGSFLHFLINSLTLIFSLLRLTSFILSQCCNIWIPGLTTGGSSICQSAPSIDGKRMLKIINISFHPSFPHTSAKFWFLLSFGPISLVHFQWNWGGGRSLWSHV